VEIPTALHCMIVDVIEVKSIDLSSVRRQGAPNGLWRITMSVDLKNEATDVEDANRGQTCLSRRSFLFRRSIQMIRCNTSISRITVTVDGWPAGCTGEAGDTPGGCTVGTGAAATTTIDEASRPNLRHAARARRRAGDRAEPGIPLHLSQRLTALANCVPMRSAVAARD
jgi:hypothetical protein